MYSEKSIFHYAKYFYVALLVVMFSLFAGCASKKTITEMELTENDGEVMLWSSESKRPKWTNEEPETKSGTMGFVGLSATHASEKNARIDAKRNANNNVLAYMGTLAKNKFEKAQIDFGLESDVIDPTSSARQFQKQLAVNIVNHLKAKKWYTEKWRTPTGIGYRTFVLAQVPQKAMQESYINSAKSMARNAEQQSKQAADKIAKKQAQKAAEFWNQMQLDGFVE